MINTLPNSEQLRAKVLVEGDIKHPSGLRIELTSDSDLYFNFQHSTNEQEFRSIKEKQNFYIEFKEYPGVILKNLQKAEKEPQTYVLIFTIFTDFDGNFTIIQRTEFKNYEILAFDFRKSPDVNYAGCSGLHQEGHHLQVRCYEGTAGSHGRAAGRHQRPGQDQEPQPVAADPEKAPL